MCARAHELIVFYFFCSAVHFISASGSLPFHVSMGLLWCARVPRPSTLQPVVGKEVQQYVKRFDMYRKYAVASNADTRWQIDCELFEIILCFSIGDRRVVLRILRATRGYVHRPSLHFIIIHFILFLFGEIKLT